MSVCVLDDTHFASVAYTLCKTETNQQSPEFDLGFHLNEADDQLSETFVVNLVTEWRKLNYLAYDDCYSVESAPEEELESLALWLGKTLTPIGLIKALHSIRYQLMDFMEKPGETGTDDDGKASGEPYNHLLTCISVVSKHIICGLPAYDKEEWFISD